MTQDGEVLRFDAERGFGFIGTTDGRRDIFFHVRDYRGDSLPRVGERVRFERIEVGGKGPRAVAVQGQGAPAQARSNPRHSARAASPASPAARSRSRPSDGPPHTRAPAPGPRPRAHAANAPRPPVRPAADRQPARPAPRALDGQPWLFALALLVWVGLLAVLVRQAALPVSGPALLGGLALLNLATFTAYAMDKRAAAQGQWRTPENTLHALAAMGGWPAAWLAQRTLRHKSRKTSFLAAYVATVLLNLGALAALWRHGG